MLKYKRTRKRVRVFGIIIVIFIIIATTLGYIYFFQVDSDGDGIPDVIDDDDDNDGMPDDWEEQYGFDPKKASDAKKDKDNDGLTNKEEYEFSSNPKKADTDSDGVNDYDECKIHHTLPYVSDTDADGLLDGWEVKYALDPNMDDAHLDPDSDGYDANHNNRLDEGEHNTNLMEYINGTNPKINDTDADGMTDGWEMYYQEKTNKLKIEIQRYNPPGKRDYNFTFDPNDKSDANEDIDVDENRNISPDGLTNLQEFLAGTDPTKPDTDGDSLTDYEEVKKYKTDPLNLDTDSDKLDDGWEIKYGGASVGLDPSKTDSDGDGDPDNIEDLDNDSYMTSFLFNIVEFLLGTSPVSNDTDGDGLTDGWEDYFGLDPLLHNDDNDTDGDLLIDRAEFDAGTDPNNVDTDGDGLTDGQELLLGFPGILIDGIYYSNTNNPHYFTNPLNNDTDADGLNDYEEVNFGEDRYKTNATNTDTDGDGIDDWEEVEINGGKDGYITNPSSIDSDNDLLTDKEEIDAFWGYNTLPTKADCDDDGLLDGEEILTDFYPFIDFDTTIYGCIDHGEIDGTDPTNPDTDSDGMEDGWEAHLGFADRSQLESLIKPYDQKNNRTNYYLQLKNDEIVQCIWLVNPLDPKDKFEDPDDDGFDKNRDGKIDSIEEYNNFEEFKQKSNPLAWDTDIDGMPDGWEVTYDLDPLTNDANLDSDNDGIIYYINRIQHNDTFTNIEEYRFGTEPNNPDTDGDKEKDYHEIWFGDDDGDGLWNGWELIFNGTPLDSGGYIPYRPMPGKFNPTKKNSDDVNESDKWEDYDGDGFSNIDEQGDIWHSPGSSDPTDQSMTPDTIIIGSRSIVSTNKENVITTYKSENELLLIFHLEISKNYIKNLYENNLLTKYLIQMNNHNQLKYALSIVTEKSKLYPSYLFNIVMLEENLKNISRLSSCGNSKLKVRIE